MDVDILIYTGSKSTLTKYDIIETRPNSWDWGAGERADPFAIITITDTSLNLHKDLKRPWQSRPQLEELGSTDRYKVTGDKARSRDGRGAVTQALIQDLIDQWGATVVDNTPNDVRFNLEPGIAGRSTRYLRRSEIPAGVTGFSHVGNVITMSHPGGLVGSEKHGIIVRLMLNGGELLDQTETETVYRVDKTWLFDELTNDLRKYTSTQDVHQHGIDSTKAAAIVNRKVTVTETVFLNDYLVNKVTDG